MKNNKKYNKDYITIRTLSDYKRKTNNKQNNDSGTWIRKYFIKYYSIIVFMDRRKVVKYCQELLTIYLGLHRPMIKGLYSG